jgi:hypothetical protein
MKIRVKIKEVEIEITDSDVNGYPRVLSADRFKDITKSERLVQVVKELTSEAIRAFNETKS